MNYGETLVHWYLRLNGFFPISNFVLHHPNGGTGQNADADLLAIRFPHVCEMIGGKFNDWDNATFKEWGLDHEKKIVGLMVEVKAGHFQRNELNTSFNQERIKYCVKRLGFFSDTDDPANEPIAMVVDALEKHGVYTNDKYSLGLLIVYSEQFIPNAKKAELNPFKQLTIEQADNFVKYRFQRYSKDKTAARFFFPNDLIQYLVWKSKELASEIPNEGELE